MVTMKELFGDNYDNWNALATYWFKKDWSSFGPLARTLLKLEFNDSDELLWVKSKIVVELTTKFKQELGNDYNVIRTYDNELFNEYKKRYELAAYMEAPTIPNQFLTYVKNVDSEAKMRSLFYLEFIEERRLLFRNLFF